MTDPALLPVLQKLVPQKDGEPYTVHRSAVVDAVNADGTADILLSGVLIPSVPVVGNAPVAPGTAVSVLAWQGALLVLGEVATSVYDTGWVNVTPASGYTAGTGVDAPQVKRRGKEIIFRGFISGQLSTSGSTIGTVPAGYRARTLNDAARAGALTNGGTCRVATGTSGAIIVHVSSGVTTGVNLSALSGYEPA